MMPSRPSVQTKLIKSFIFSDFYPGTRRTACRPQRAAHARPLRAVVDGGGLAWLYFLAYVQRADLYIRAHRAGKLDQVRGLITERHLLDQMLPVHRHQPAGAYLLGNPQRLLR